MNKIGAAQHYAYATRGALLGVAASIGLGIAVTMLSGPLLDLGPDLIGLGVIFVAVIVLTWHGYWMRQHARAIKGEVQRRIEEAHASHRLWVIGVIAFTGVFREGAETVLFLWGLMTQAASAYAQTGRVFESPRGHQFYAELVIIRRSYGGRAAVVPSKKLFRRDSLAFFELIRLFGRSWSDGLGSSLGPYDPQFIRTGSWRSDGELRGVGLSPERARGGRACRSPRQSHRKR